MVTERLYSLQQLQQSHALKFMDDLVKEVYPMLFEQLYTIQSGLVLLDSSNKAIQVALSEKIGLEMDAIYSKEKLVLFPFIRTLHSRQQKSDSCKPFKNVKLHYSSMLALLIELKASLSTEEEEGNDALSINHVKQLLRSFEKQLIMLQVTKDKYLFAHFKSCQGCKINTA
ncbi:hypothetical protein [Ferruginibacter sp. HRS2-29]|uniref:hypothetical protein n=1 Tax=Ferruginibacter sp. HRS2-29 TaxID=2487334 RepID=UPI0020CFC228|nr:hypothetical protein [Ferruginibacter sp. HRS2-29]MCP9752986.1 hypothetical protein [Ferruginibacter sp. HRS2-29]